MDRADEWSGAGMSGKGSTPRPIEVDRKTYEDNWDRIFERNNPTKGASVEMWEHHCSFNGRHMVEVGHCCSWCGEYEDGTLD